MQIIYENPEVQVGDIIVLVFPSRQSAINAIIVYDEDEYSLLSLDNGMYLEKGFATIDALMDLIRKEYDEVDIFPNSEVVIKVKRNNY